MSEYVDCPQCGMEEIPPRARMCSACEVDERNSKVIAEKEAELASLRSENAKLVALLKRVPQFDCHPSEDRHSDLCIDIRAALASSRRRG